MNKRLWIGFMGILLFLSGCAKSAGTRETVPETEQTAAVSESFSSETEAAALSEPSSPGAETAGAGSLYLLLSTDTINGVLHVRDIETGEESDAFYSGATVFSDKYGTMVSLSQIRYGDAVTLDFFDSGVLSRVQLSGETWNEKDVTDYHVDLDRMIFTIHDSNYRLTKDVPVYNDGENTGLYSISEGDRLNVTGLQKDVLSITVVTGTGTIAFRNTGVFLGGWLNLDNAQYLLITENMEIPAAEGTHVLTVANDGWGDSTVVAVKRGQRVLVDLSALKGEGPKYCALRIIPDVEEATVYLDGKKMDTEQPEEVRYGLHTLTITAEGYEDWQSRLLVNSASAEIEIPLSPKGSVKTGSQENASAGSTAGTASSVTDTGTAGSVSGSMSAPVPAGEGTAGSLAGSLADSGHGTGSTRREAEQAAAETALETLTGMLDTLTGTSLSGNE